MNTRPQYKTVDPDATTTRVTVHLRAGDRALLHRLSNPDNWRSDFDRMLVATFLWDLRCAAHAADRRRGLA